MNDFSYKDLVVVYEDNQIIVVYKPQNVPSQADDSKDMDMLTAVKEYVKEKYNKPGEAYIGLVHRLDRPTGGVMVFARTSKAAERLCESIKDDDFQKVYYCVTCATPKDPKGHLLNYLKKDVDNNVVKIALMGEEGAKRAELDYEVLNSYKGFALLKVVLQTGRSHQIRVQLANIGCPLFGDAKYGADSRTIGKNLALWATEVSFTHPTQKDRRKFIVYPPVDEAPWKAFDASRFLSLNISTSPYQQTLINSKTKFEPGSDN